MFSPGLRASRMTVGVAHILLQMSKDPVVFGCAEVVANRLCRPTAGAPACAEKSFDQQGQPQYTLTDYGVAVKEKLEKWLCLSEN